MLKVMLETLTTKASDSSVGGGGAEGSGEAPKDFAKPRQTIQSPNRLYKAPERLYKAPTDYTKPRNIIETFKILNKTLQYSTSTQNIKQE